jgi:3-phenylpropionate/trans-cinnamate dioxygenase ferredoxin reductase component
VSGPLAMVVIGGGPAGMSAVRGYRQAGGLGAVAIVCDEERMPYRRPPLTKELLRGEMDESGLPLEAETWLAEHSVSLVSGRAVALDPAAHTVTLAGGRRLEYDHCVLATGSEPVRPAIPGCDDPGVRVVRSLDHVRELVHRLRSAPDAIVIGSGFIGCEIAASLRRRGHAVTLISDEAVPNARRLGREAGAELAQWLSDEGVNLRLGAGVEEIRRQGEALQVTAGESDVSARVVVMATGVAPRAELLAGADEVLSDGAVAVDDGMRTALPDLLAAGDVCRAHNAVAGRALRVEHWGDALEQGEVAGLTAAGAAASWDSVPGFWSTIGKRTLKYAAWGDGYDEATFERRPGGGFAAWYGSDGALVGVLAHEADDCYEKGRELIAAGASWS